jgi:hypothetical protein
MESGMSIDFDSCEGAWKWSRFRVRGCCGMSDTRGLRHGTYSHHTGTPKRDA